MKIGISKLYWKKKGAPTSASGITFRGDVHYVVTEYGFALLVGKRIKERVQELINISHSKFKDELTKYVKDTYNN